MMEITLFVQVRPAGSATPVSPALTLTLDLAPSATLTAGQLLGAVAQRAAEAASDDANASARALHALLSGTEASSPGENAMAAHRAGRFWLFVNNKPATSLSQPLPLWRRLEMLVLALSRPAQPAPSVGPRPAHL